MLETQGFYRQDNRHICWKLRVSVDRMWPAAHVQYVSVLRDPLGRCLAKGQIFYSMGTFGKNVMRYHVIIQYTTYTRHLVAQVFILRSPR